MNNIKSIRLMGLGIIIFLTSLIFLNVLITILGAIIGSILAIWGYVSLDNNENGKVLQYCVIFLLSGSITIGIGILLFFFNKIISVIVSLVGLIVAIYGLHNLIIIYNYQKEHLENSNKEIDTFQKPINTTKTVPKKEWATSCTPSFLGVLGDELLLHIYSDVPVVGVQHRNINIKDFSAGLKAKLIPEPDNEFDSNAIAIYCNNQKIGYIAKGTLQKNILHRLKNNERADTIISNIDDEKSYINIYIAFYKNVQEYTANKNGISCSLTGTSVNNDFVGNIQDNYDTVSEGDIVFLKYDVCEDYFNVYTDDFYYDSLGHITKTVSNKISDELGTDKLFAIIDDITYSTAGKASANITVYPII